MRHKVGSCFQRLNQPNIKSYIGPGKAVELMRYLNSTGIRIIVFDDDLTNKQIRNLEYIFEENGGEDVKVKKLIF